MQRLFNHRERKEVKEDHERRQKRRQRRRWWWEISVVVAWKIDAKSFLSTLRGIRKRTVVGGGARPSDEETTGRRGERKRRGGSESDREVGGVHSIGFEEFERVEKKLAGVFAERTDDVFTVRK